jgi:Zn-dependent M28 family amino/carboxypeptidase
VPTIVANLQFEMIGRPDPAVPPHTLWLTGYERSDLGEALRRRGARLVADARPAQNFFQRSDNYGFALEGVVAHTVSSYGLHREYHTPKDELRTIDLAHMAAVISGLFEPVLWLATTDWKPSWAPGGRPRRAAPAAPKKERRGSARRSPRATGSCASSAVATGRRHSREPTG